VKKSFFSAEIVKTREGRQYHIGLAPGEVAPFIILSGDTERVHKIASFFEEAGDPVCSREYKTITGRYNGIPVSAMATGMGPDNTEIAIVELSQIVKNPTFIRVGSSGAIKENIAIGDLVISTASLRMENTSLGFVWEGFPAFAHHEVILSLITSASRLRARFHTGITATASGFYGAQGRKTGLFNSISPDLLEKLNNMNVSNMEMETSVLFTLSALAGFRAGAVCAIYAQRHENKFIDSETKEAAERNCIKVALGAIEILNEMDRRKGKNKYWLPSMGI